MDGKKHSIIIFSFLLSFFLITYNISKNILIKKKMIFYFQNSVPNAIYKFLWFSKFCFIHDWFELITHIQTFLLNFSSLGTTFPSFPFKDSIYFFNSF